MPHCTVPRTRRNSPLELSLDYQRERGVGRLLPVGFRKGATCSPRVVLELARYPRLSSFLPQMALAAAEVDPSRMPPPSPSPWHDDAGSKSPPLSADVSPGTRVTTESTTPCRVATGHGPPRAIIAVLHARPFAGRPPERGRSNPAVSRAPGCLGPCQPCHGPVAHAHQGRDQRRSRVPAPPPSTIAAPHPRIFREVFVGEVAQSISPDLGPVVVLGCYGSRRVEAAIF